MQGLGYLGRFRPFPHVIPDLWAGISRPRGGEEILGPPLVGFSPRSGGGLVAEDTVEVRLGARRYELTDWLGNVRVVLTDQGLPIYKGKKLVGYRAEVVEVRDYYLIEVMAAPSIPIATPSMVRKTLGKSGGDPRETSFQCFGKGRRPQNIGSMMDVLELARQAKARTSMVEVDRLRPLSVDSLPMDVSSNLITPMETLNQE